MLHCHYPRRVVSVSYALSKPERMNTVQVRPAPVGWRVPSITFVICDLPHSNRAEEILPGRTAVTPSAAISAKGLFLYPLPCSCHEIASLLPFFYPRGQKKGWGGSRVFASPRPPLLPLNLSKPKCICTYSMWTWRFVNPNPRKEAAPNRCLCCCFLSVTAAVKAPSLCQANTASKVLCGFFVFTFGYLGLWEQDIDQAIEI